MSAAHHALMSYGWKPILAGGVTFDGTNDYMTRGGGLTGAADSKTGILSFWIKINVNPSANKFIVSGDGLVTFIYNANEQCQISIAGAADGLTKLGMASGAMSVGSWHHILASWNVAGASATESHLYLDDASSKTVSAFTNATLDYTVADWSIGASGSSFKIEADLAELYFAPGQYLDFSVESNRRKFITATKRPMNLGVDGSTPTGSAPIVYQSIVVGEAVANFGVNNGSGGNFTVNGTLTASSDSPSG